MGRFLEKPPKTQEKKKKAKVYKCDFIKQKLWHSEGNNYCSNEVACRIGKNICKHCS